MMMFERFTDRARKVMQLANHEAQRFNHEYVGTEHFLLGLVKEDTGIASEVLKSLEVDLRKIRNEVKKLVQSGPEMITMGKLPFTPHAKKVIEYSMEEARGMNHNFVGTEHVLLGLLRDQDGMASQILMNLGLKIEEVRAKVIEAQEQSPEYKTISELVNGPDKRCSPRKSWPMLKKVVEFETHKICLDEGSANISIPKGLSSVSVKEFEYFMTGIINRIKRNTGSE